MSARSIYTRRRDGLARAVLHVGLLSQYNGQARKPLLPYEQREAPRGQPGDVGAVSVTLGLWVLRMASPIEADYSRVLSRE